MVWLIVGLLVMAVTVIYTMRGIRRELERINCERTDHWPEEFENRDTMGNCPLCEETIANRPPEGLDDDAGIPLFDDTLHQQLSPLEAALHVKRPAKG